MHFLITKLLRWRHAFISKIHPGGHADTTETIERTLVIAVRYALKPAKLASALMKEAIAQKVPFIHPNTQHKVQNSTLRSVQEHYWSIHAIINITLRKIRRTHALKNHGGCTLPGACTAAGPVE